MTAKVSPGHEDQIYITENIKSIHKELNLTSILAQSSSPDSRASHSMQSFWLSCTFRSTPRRHKASTTELKDFFIASSRQLSDDWVLVVINNDKNNITTDTQKTNYVSNLFLK